MNLQHALSGFLLVVSVWLIFDGIKHAVYSFLSRSWPVVRGTVEIAKLQVDSTDGGFSYNAKIMYRYKVKGHEFIGTRIKFGDTAYAWSWLARRLLQKYPPGTTINVRYSPHNPSLSVLDSAFSLSLYWILFGLFIGAVAWTTFVAASKV